MAENNAVKISKNVLNDGRRFSMMIEGVSPVLSGDGTLVTGDVFGKIKKGDEMYVLTPFGKAKGSIIGIQIEKEGKLVVEEEAEDVAVSMVVDCEHPDYLKKCAVISSVAPTEKFDPTTPIENSYLAGLLFAAPKYQKDKNFIGLLSSALAHAIFLVPMRVEPQEDGKDPKVGFYMLPAKKPAEGETPKEFLFPVFTDFEELSKYKAVAKEGVKVPINVLKFQQIVDLIKPEPTVGFIVNPFSKNMILAAKPFIEAIINSAGYKRDFGPKEETQED